MGKKRLRSTGFVFFVYMHLSHSMAHVEAKFHWITVSNGLVF